MLGRKSGSGFYKYEGKQQTDNEALEEWRQVPVSDGETSARPSAGSQISARSADSPIVSCS